MSEPITAITTEQNFKELDPTLTSEETYLLDSSLRSRVVGQDRAIKSVVNIIDLYRAGFTSPGKPLGTLLFLGPTGTGKSYTVAALSDLLFGNPSSFIRIDCAEFQHSHEIAKLVGSPPGYLGHRETAPVLTQEHVNSFHTDRIKITLILFDEIEKASDALWQLLLGILDNASLTLGDNRKVDFSGTFIFMTSNLGSKEIGDLIHGSIGFAPARSTSMDFEALDQKIYRTATDAARRKFSPEFVNRLDKMVVFRSLTHDQMTKIVELEIAQLQKRILMGFDKKFVLFPTQAAKELLLNEGIDYRYGARHLKRAIRRFVETPLSRLLSTGQIKDGATIKVDEREGKLVFLSAS